MSWSSSPLMQPSIYFFNGICRASSTSTPVSYTHLDVYKRQPVDAADKAHGQTAYDSEDISGGMGLLTPEGPAVGNLSQLISGY